MKIVFFGSPDFSVPFLKALLNDDAFDVVGIVTQPDKPAGRGNRVLPTPVKAYAHGVGMDVFEPPTLKSNEVVKKLASYKADVFVVFAYGKIIPQAVLDIPRLGCVNVHPSLLPKHRGPTPMPSALASGDTQTGVTIMLLDAGMDTGPILSFETIEIDADETLETLTKKVIRVGAPLLVSTLKRHANGEIVPIKQDDARATVTKLLEREDGHIDWTKSMAEIERLVRAYQPWPGTWSICQFPAGKGSLDIMKPVAFVPEKSMRLKIQRVSPSDFRADLAPGQILVRDKQMFVDCADGTIEILQLQPEGKSSMDAATFVRGNSDVSGAILA